MNDQIVAFKKQNNQENDLGISPQQIVISSEENGNGNDGPRSIQMDGTASNDSNSSGNNSILGSLNSLDGGMDKSRLPSPRIMFISLFLMAPFILFVVMLLYYYFIGHCNIICNS